MKRIVPDRKRKSRECKNRIVHELECSIDNTINKKNKIEHVIQIGSIDKNDITNGYELNSNQSNHLEKNLLQFNEHNYCNNIELISVNDDESNPNQAIHLQKSSLLLNEHNYCNNVELFSSTGQLNVSQSTQVQNLLHFNEHNYCNNASLLPSTSTTTTVHSESNRDNNFLNNISEHYLGAMNVLCIHCSAKHFKAEKVSNKGNSFNNCCSHGKVVLDCLPEPPSILKQLFDGKHSLSKHFYDHIRYYNNVFSFASFNANLVQFNNRRPGPYCFKIQGQIYYQINTSLYPANDELPRYGQLFIVDANEATNYRLNMNSNLNAEILNALHNVMVQNNVFAHSYQMMKDELESMVSENDGQEPELQLLFTLKKGQDKRRFNFQKVNEVAAIFSTTAEGEIPESYVTIRNKNTKSLQYVSSMDANVEPWTYPLFYPYGNRGWHDSIEMVGNKRRVTRNAYIKYRMAIRNNTNYILMGRRLFQQWTVDNYVKIEKDRMTFLRNNQKQLRADTYEGLLNHLEQRATDANCRVGKVVILPSSYIGSPRNMLQSYQDAMTIVRSFGTPDLFITMTCNPKWREITENLLDGQTASDRPDLVARVFELKKEELIFTIVKKKLFGEVKAYVYVVEYQKRGLPHIHLLVTLKSNYKISTPEIVDKYISAEIPNPNENLELHEIVKANMIHGPCGDWCFDKDGKCSKHFPKSFTDHTTMDEDGYPKYKRKNTGTYVRRDNSEFDSRYVVPYNKELLLLFRSHINVECVKGVKSVKYLFKYIYKGHDAASVIIGDSNNTENEESYILNHDEIKNYIETRYVSPPEACGRILSNDLQGRSHSVYRLPIHLQNQQSVVIDNIDDPEAIRSALSRSTELSAYFTLNQNDPLAKNFSYSEIPSHYVFKKKRGTSTFVWEKRKSQFNVLGRMYSISPTQVELFHLRLLLLSVKGATSFENLRTVNGTLHDSFVSTCLSLGLIEDDSEWENAMTEAKLWMMPQQLRRLFVRLLIHCHPISPEKLWEKFKDDLSQDYSRSMPENIAHRKAYIQINTLLNEENYSLASFPSMPQITETDDNIDSEWESEQHRNIGTQQYLKLNEKQKEVVDRILNTVDDQDSNNDRCFFIHGPGGSGKTFIYTTLYHILKSQGRKMCTMAFTGIAATLLPYGKTVHKTFKLPIAIYSDSSQTIKAQSKEADYLRSIEVFIWDEAPMAPRHVLELVDRNLRDITNDNRPFGNKIMILGGDFKQLLPVKINATRSELVDLCIKFSSIWPVFHQFSLTANMRTLPHEVEFAEFLLSVGNGTDNDNDDNLHLPESCIAPRNTDIVEDIYGEVIRQKQFEKLSKMAILSARNVDVDDINKAVVELLNPETEKIYTSVNSTKNCDNGEMGEALLPEYLETLNPPCLPPHELRLRENSVIMLIRNLSINEGLCNGTRLQVLELGNHLLKCKILTGDKMGQIVFINRITLYSDDRYPFQFSRRQFPIKLAFAMTINKSQGQTFDKIGIDLRRDVFNHGQLYVAMSRVRSWDSLKIYLGNQRESNIKIQLRRVQTQDSVKQKTFRRKRKAKQNFTSTRESHNRSNKETRKKALECDSM
ncbi:uncharacterized protein LOC122501545 [Leptopilina heterotoma]|uniref:uncharacterized protein LOC122499089 n=1 Tax=Leptopilina heterotoma TaxID=63436 RepID=UPI001CA9A676|nr:uncharacterized protein LOC122499089 [Leptopilina heterotoma]XP_043467020.1 uncharacterized protein LOC122501545 [Leptopilina heterotoma]